jgi:hypothetical protein
VINKSGRLRGYGGGLRRKECLLRLEKRHLVDATMPRVQD